MLRADVDAPCIAALHTPRSVDPAARHDVHATTSNRLRECVHVLRRRPRRARACATRESGEA
jgi:hypothetical protein